MLVLGNIERRVRAMTRKYFKVSRLFFVKREEKEKRGEGGLVEANLGCLLLESKSLPQIR